MVKPDWQKIYQDHSPKLLGICRRYIQDIYAAEDIVQDSFIAAIQNKHQLRDEKLLFAWLKKIVVNNALQYLRKNSKEIFVTTEISEIPDILSEMSNPVSEDQGLIFIYDFTREELLSSIDNLPPHHKSVFNLFFIENYSHADISGLLGITVNTSKSHLLRAKKSIQNYLLEKVDQNTTQKKKKKIIQLFIFLGFGNLLWAQTFKTQFVDFRINPIKNFKVPENQSINPHLFSSISNRLLTKKVIISCTALLVIIISVLILKPKNKIFIKEEQSLIPDSPPNEKKLNSDNINSYPTSIKENLNQNNSQPPASKTQIIPTQKNSGQKEKVKKVIIEDSIENTPKKVIIVKKIIQRDTIFVER